MRIPGVFYILFALLLQLSPFGNSDPGSPDGHSSPLPARELLLYASTLLPSLSAYN